MTAKLYVDDNRKSPHGWEVARNAEEAKLHLLHHPVDDISLDYDLDMPECNKCQFVCGLREGACRHGCDCHGEGDETGLHLLHWIHKHNAWPKNPPTVHSHNLVGAMKMKKFIQDYYPQK
jgi:hypothetical protein